MARIVTIIGGGVSGLALAWRLKQRHGREIEITLVEKSHRVGGWIETLQEQGFLFELGPRSFRSEGDGKATLELIQQLGLRSSLIQAAPSARYRYLFTNGSLQPLPTGAASLLTSPLTRPLIWPLMKEWSVARGVGDETIHAFAERRLGRYAAEVLFDPMTLGVFAGDSRRLSLKSCFPSLYRYEQCYGSLTRGLLRAKKTGALYSLRGGMGQLVTTLSHQLDATILTDTEVVAIESDHIGLEGGSQIAADHTYCAIPASQMARLLRRSSPEAAALLDLTPTVTIATVCLGYHRVVTSLKGFGYLVPSKEKEPILGAVWDSSIFPQQQGTTRITVMVREGAYDYASVALEAVERHMGIKAKPDLVHVRVAKNAIPQYVVGHDQRIEDIESSLTRDRPCITLLGNHLHGISVNECIAYARKIAG